jgi:hypothetical protein
MGLTYTPACTTSPFYKQLTCPFVHLHGPDICKSGPAGTQVPSEVVEALLLWADHAARLCYALKFLDPEASADMYIKQHSGEMIAKVASDALAASTLYRYT